MNLPEPGTIRFVDDVALVTGAAGGMGSAIARRLAREGASVVLVDRADLVKDVAAEIADSGATVTAIIADLAERAECERVAREARETYGRIDVLVNNAGINRRGALLDLTENDWDISFAVNLDSMFHLTRAILPSMMERGGGSIVNTASQWGLHPAPGHLAYCVSKAGVASFSQCLARDYAPHGIRVNAVCPGEVRTGMLAAGLEQSGRTWEDLDALVPFGRIGTPEEIAALVAFLASGEAPFLCGALVEITGAQAAA